MLHLLLFQLAALSAPAPAPTRQGLISADDYPAQAFNHGWQGDVVYDATVGTNGRITACTIVKSSGYAVLDERTCKIVTERARFSPAIDSSGAAVESHYSGHINWRLGN